MTVKELSAILEGLDPEATVVLEVGSTSGYGPTVDQGRAVSVRFTQTRTPKRGPHRPPGVVILTTEEPVSLEWED